MADKDVLSYLEKAKNAMVPLEGWDGPSPRVATYAQAHALIDIAEKLGRIAVALERGPTGSGWEKAFRRLIAQVDEERPRSATAEDDPWRCEHQDGD